jgi:uncharacterized protein YlxW (UPF0749 family)
MADYEKLQKEDADLEAQIKTLDSTLDYYTKDNREQRKVLQERRNTVAKQKDALLGAIAQLQQGMRQLYANVENNLALAKHAGDVGVEGSGKIGYSAVVIMRAS